MIISRGHGRGHAMPDMAIGAKLAALVPNLCLRFVSYAAGADAYRACGYEVLDLHLPDRPSFLDVLIAFTRLLAKTKPDLVIAHEEMTVLPAAEAFNIPCFFITDFFMDPNNLSMQALRYASEVIFTAQSGLYTEPPYLRGKVHYVGRAVRAFEFTVADRERARREVNIPLDATVVLCQPGAWLESQVPLVDLLRDAWDLLPRFSKRLIWLGGRDYQLLTAAFRGRPDIIVLKEDWKIDRLMAASDVLITKANRMTVYEAAAIGLPSISISSLVNWPDDVAVANVESNTPALRDSLTAEKLSTLIAKKADTEPPAATELSGGIAGAVARIAHHIDGVRRRESSAVS
jgi:UDP-N-acetylglucosamine:LPS N-acetylglucosamine transferase